jgi:hypothetical protein
MGIQSNQAIEQARKDTGRRIKSALEAQIALPEQIESPVIGA